MSGFFGINKKESSNFGGSDYQRGFADGYKSFTQGNRTNLNIFSVEYRKGYAAGNEHARNEYNASRFF